MVPSLTGSSISEKKWAPTDDDLENGDSLSSWVKLKSWISSSSSLDQLDTGVLEIEAYHHPHREIIIVSQKINAKNVRSC
jgi:hypothetical protein